MSDIKKIRYFVEEFLSKSDNSADLYLVGGAVIDLIEEREVKDWDIEIFGMSFDIISNVLEKMGLNWSITGEKFGVLKTNYMGLDLDISVPRKENKIGKGHKSFMVEFPSDISIRDAALRRDLTINSMSINLKDMSLIDYFGGKSDLEEGIIRAIYSMTFVEDPLRVLRIMQLLPRKGKYVDRFTVELCKSMIGEYDYLPKERVFEEFSKLLLKADKPSVGLRFLEECGWLKKFEALYDMVGCPQNIEWHPEGDVWTHSLNVIDNAAKLRDRIPEDWKLAFMFGALLHDVGKPSTTDDELKSHGHDKAGEEIAINFMNQITNDKKLIEKVSSIVINHMRLGNITRDKRSKIGAWKRLHNDIRLDIAAYISLSDFGGKYDDFDVYSEHEPSRKALEWFDKFGEKTIDPVLKGRHLIDIGMKPGPVFGSILKRAYEIQIDENIDSYELILDILRKEDLL